MSVSHKKRFRQNFLLQPNHNLNNNTTSWVRHGNQYKTPFVCSLMWWAGDCSITESPTPISKTTNFHKNKITLVNEIENFNRTPPPMGKESPWGISSPKIHTF